MAVKPKPEIQTVRGMQDILPEEYTLRKRFLEKAEKVANFYGFSPIHTPYLEKEELFTAGIGENTDIVEKQMYSLRTRGGDKLVLRPEGTAPIMRAYLEHGLHTKPQPVMLYYDGFFFRHESPQKGRRRELQQFGLEIIGESNSVTDALVIKTCFSIFEEAGIKPLKIHLNSIGDPNCRKSYQKELLSYYRKKVNQICKDCKRRIKTNPFRLLDCKEEKCVEIKQEAPQIINHLCESCTAHFKNLLEILDASDVAYYLDHYLVRGLDYYSRTVFEIFPDNNSITNSDKTASNEETTVDKAEAEPEIGTKDTAPPPAALALAGGGRYDYLARSLARKEVPAVGCAMGIDRAIEFMREKNIRSHTTEDKLNKIFFIQLGQAARNKSLGILETLRKAHISTGHSLNKDSLKTQLKIAAKVKAQYALILGQKEAMDQTIIVRNMEMVSQETIPINQLIDYLKKVK